MSPLLTDETVAGSWISAARAHASWVGEAWFDGVVAVAWWPVDAVAAMLPEGWVPAVGSTHHEARRPVLFAFGRQRRTAILFGGLTLPSDADYDEVLVAVPFVRHVTGAHLHTFVPRMVSGDPRATWAGNASYGFGKVPGAIERVGSTLAVIDHAGRVRAHASVVAHGAWRSGADVSTPVPAVAAASTISRMPVLGRRHDGREIEAYFDWSFEHASVRPIHARITVDPGFAPGITAGSWSTRTDCGFDVRGMRWRLSWPGACRR